MGYHRFRVRVRVRVRVSALRKPRERVQLHFCEARPKGSGLGSFAKDWQLSELKVCAPRGFTEKFNWG